MYFINSHQFSSQAFLHHIVHNSYGILIKFLPQTLANMSHRGEAGVGPRTPTTGDADAAQLRTSSSDVSVTASDYNEQLNEGAPLPPTHSILERPAAPSFTNESHVWSLSPTRPFKAECPPEFSHPAAIEEQRTIWLPKDPLGLVDDLEEELASHKILYSSDGAEMDGQGKVNVTSASPEDVRRAPRPRPCERVGEEKGLFSYGELMSVFQRYEARFRR